MASAKEELKKNSAFLIAGTRIDGRPLLRRSCASLE